MSIKDTLRKDMFNATKEGNIEKSDIIKMALASIINVEKEEGKELEGSQIEKILRKEVKKVQDSISQYTIIGRQDLIQRESKQLEVLQSYLPKQMDTADVEKVVKTKIEESNADSIKDMGKVIGLVMKEIGDKTDGNIVREIVQRLLQ